MAHRKNHFDKNEGWDYWRKCRLPSCGREFGTNRAWQHFCPGTKHQQEYQKFLRRKHADMVVEIEELKEAIKKLQKFVEEALDTFEGYRRYLHKQFQTGGTPVELRRKIRALENKK